MNNPMQIMQLLRGIKNPKETVFQLLKGNNNPIMKNIVEMAEKGDTKGVENFARNLFKEQNRDFDKEYSKFMEMMKQKKH